MDPMQPLLNAMFGAPPNGPYVYPQSPYGLGDLVPGNMPTRWGALMPIPEAAELLANHGPATAPAEYFAKSLAQETGRSYDTAIREFRPLPVNLDQRPDAGLPVGNAAFLSPMPSVFYPRPNAEEMLLAETPVESIGCWVENHSLLAVGLAGLVYWAFQRRK